MLEQARQNHIGRLLLRANRSFVARALLKLQARGHTTLSVSHTELLPHLDVDGTRATLLAERSGLSKQAVGQLIAELEAQGYLERQPDPTDRRAAIIFFTALGWKFLLDAQEVKREISSEYQQFLGQDVWEALQQNLERLLEFETVDKSED